jgi:acyl-ACP thioesterase
MGAAPHTSVLLEVYSFQVDPQGRLTLPDLCAFLQEAAWRNAEARGVGVVRLAADGLAWVLQRLRIEVAAYPRQGDTVVVTTWARSFERALARRDFEVHDQAGARLAAATSVWVLVDLAARRLVRLPDFVRAAQVAARPPALATEPAALPALETAEHERRVEVRRSDLDVVHHVNNTRYVDWALEAVPEAWTDRSPSALDLVFRRECVLGDRVVSRSRKDGALRLVHALCREGEALPLAEGLSEWLGPPGA